MGVTRALQAAEHTYPRCCYSVAMADTTKDRVVRLPRGLVDQMQTIAKAHERSLAAELRVALDAYVRRTLPEADRMLEERTR
jgi:Arc-like DNA binding domain